MDKQNVYDAESLIEPIHSDISHMSRVLIIDDDEQVCDIRAFHIRNKFTTLPHAATDLTNVGNPLQFKDYMEKMKHAYLQDLVAATSGGIPECCRRSGLSRSQMYRLIQQ